MSEKSWYQPRAHQNQILGHQASRQWSGTDAGTGAENRDIHVKTGTGGNLRHIDDYNLSR